MNGAKDRAKAVEIIESLRKLRDETVVLNVQVSKIQQKIRLNSLDLKRIESSTILEVHRAMLDNGRPAYSEEWTRKARVEEILAKNERFNSLLKKHRLLHKQLQRKEKLAGINTAKTLELEAHEKLFLLS